MGTELGKDYRAIEPDTVQRRALRIVKGTATFKDRFVQEHEDLVKLIDSFRLMGCIVAFTCGVWDLIHIGHLEYIALGKQETAKLYPDADQVVMVVGVDTDELTKKRKGPDRPIVPQDERLRMLGHIRSVDVLALQYELNQLYGVVSPHVQIVSTSTKDLPADMEEVKRHCEHIVNLPPQAETSTTARIRRLTLDGAAGVLLKIEKGLTATLQEVRSEIEKK